MLSAEVRETFIGYAKIKEVFKITGVGKIGGCEVTEGLARRAAGVRLLRDDVVIHEGRLKTLKRFKDEVKDVHMVVIRCDTPELSSSIKTPSSSIEVHLPDNLWS